jgi:hypothetical protein
MSDHLTEDECADVLRELAKLYESERALCAAESVSFEAALRRDETLIRVRSEIRRLERLLSSTEASPPPADPDLVVERRIS